jgi:arylsulfatase A-like enzyme
VDQEGFEDWWSQGKLKKESGYSTDLINQHAINFIERNKNESFLLYIAHEAPHYPIQGRASPAEREIGSKKFIAHGSEKNKPKIYKEMVEVMDDGIGKIIKTISELNLDKKTIVFFFSDNGGTKLGNNGKLRAYKGSVYEGGHRVSALVWSPELIEAGRISNETIMTMDIYPTISDLIGAIPPEDIDGLSFKNHLLEGEKVRERSLFWEFNSNLAMRKNQWKMVIGRKNKIPELYNLQDDLGETSNMAEEKPELIKEMLKEMESWKKHVDF